MNDAEFEQHAREQLMRELRRVPVPTLPQRRSRVVRSVGLAGPGLVALVALVLLLVIVAGTTLLPANQSANQQALPALHLTPQTVAETIDPTAEAAVPTSQPLQATATPAPTVVLGIGGDSVFGATEYWQMPWMQYGDQLAVLNDDGSVRTFGRWRDQARLLYALPRLQNVPLGIGMNESGLLVLIEPQPGTLVETQLSASSLAAHPLIAPDNLHLAVVTQQPDSAGHPRQTLAVIDATTGSTESFPPEAFSVDPASTVELIAWTPDGLWLSLSQPAPLQPRLLMFDLTRRVIGQDAMLVDGAEKRLHSLVAQQSLPELAPQLASATDWIVRESPDGAWAFVGIQDGSGWRWSLVPAHDSGGTTRQLEIARESADTLTTPAEVRWSANGYYMLVLRTPDASGTLLDVFNVDGEHLLTSRLPSQAQAEVTNSGRLLIINASQLFVQPLTGEDQAIAYALQEQTAFIR